MEKPLNQSLNNEFFEIKKRTYANTNCILTKSIDNLTISTNSTSQHGQLFQNLPHWNTWIKESIEQRQELLLKLAKEVWVLTTISSGLQLQ